MDGRTPPSSPTAERAVLGSVLLDRACLAQAKAYLTEADFYLEPHRRIWQAMEALDRDGAPIDAVTLGEALHARGDYDRVGGAAQLVALSEETAVTAHVTHYAAIVARHAARRAAITAAQETIAEAYSVGDDETDAFLDAARTRMTAATQLRGRPGSGPQRVAADLAAAYRAMQQGIPPRVVPTGLEPYDRFYGGLWPGLTHVIGGRPAMGKSALALNIAANAALAGRRVLYLCLEDTRQQTALRLYARFANQDLQAMALGRIADLNLVEVVGATPRLAALPLWVDDTPGLTSAAAVQIARRHAAHEGLDLLVVDHLGEVTDQGESETAIASHAVMTIRDVAKELDVPLLLAVQLNRDIERRQNKRPQLSDLRQSGVIEQVARFVLFPYRGGYYVGEPQRRDMELIIAKASNFPTAMFRMWADLSRMYIRAWEVSRDGQWTGDLGEAEGRSVRTAHEPTERY